MSAHTPGPWDYFVGNANGRGLIRVETAIDARPHAGVHITSLARGGNAEANARLIAAAPELLASLRETVEAVSELDQRITSRLRREFDRARAAIAKAEGR